MVLFLSILLLLLMALLLSWHETVLTYPATLLSTADATTTTTTTTTVDFQITLYEGVAAIISARCPAVFTVPSDVVVFCCFLLALDAFYDTGRTFPPKRFSE